MQPQKIAFPELLRTATLIVLARIDTIQGKKTASAQVLRKFKGDPGGPLTFDLAGSGYDVKEKGVYVLFLIRDGAGYKIAGSGGGVLPYVVTSHGAFVALLPQVTTLPGKPAKPTPEIIKGLPSKTGKDTIVNYADIVRAVR